MTAVQGREQEIGSPNRPRQKKSREEHRKRALLHQSTNGNVLPSSHKAKKQQLQHDTERKNQDLAILDYSRNNLNVQNISVIDQAYNHKNAMEHANVGVKK